MKIIHALAVVAIILAGLIFGYAGVLLLDKTPPLPIGLFMIGLGADISILLPFVYLVAIKR